jgi:hypothetical protein
MPSLAEAGYCTVSLETTRQRMDYCYVEFEAKDDGALSRLSTFFAMVKAAKESEEPLEEEQHLIGYLTDDERSFFWDPSPVEIEEWNKDWFSTPLPRRHTDEALQPRWQLESMLGALWDGEYDLVGVLQEGKRHFVAFNPEAYPYGGTASLVALVECFGHQVVGIEDGTGYVAYVPRKKFWQSRTSRGL